MQFDKILFASKAKINVSLKNFKCWVPEGDLHCFAFSAYCVMLWAAAAANSVSNFTKLMCGGEDFLRQISHNSIMKKTKLRFFFKWTLSNTLTEIVLK